MPHRAPAARPVRPLARFRRIQPIAATALAAAAALLAIVAPALESAPAEAHGFTSVVYADVAGDRDGAVHATLQLEYDLLVVSAADAAGGDDALFGDGTDAFDARDEQAEVAAIQKHEPVIVDYIAKRFQVKTGSGDAAEVCKLMATGDLRMTVRQDAPYLVIPFDAACADSAATAHEITSTLFPDSEQFVKSTKTIVTYEIDGQKGSASLDAQQPAFSTEQSFGERFWEFFHLGAEHLLTGIDHILFLLALIAGSRRLREVVLAATTFTIAHSVTFILAATGVVSAPSEFVEPVIALSIAVVAGWHLWRLWRQRRTHAVDHLDQATGFLRLDRAGWLRLLAVFLFGLVHGLGFASALGIDEPWSWTLLWSLLVFNVGIEAVQLGIIAIVFPLLMLLRRRVPTVGRWVTGIVAGGVALMGLVWFVERILGIDWI
ncbi:HupE/UreJ family protein [Schumannella soli]|uniref:HupE/UreJ family protein n=1 Tax=Schumannella soli TaxID=2590779 RepID=A0A506Y6U5_9MICO|nr:HupE/UreJ family protein [Schumannella soli]TPW77735.1 HupE/UreJ family protein [Schumannella soli]